MPDGRGQVFPMPASVAGAAAAQQAATRGTRRSLRLASGRSVPFSREDEDDLLAHLMVMGLSAEQAREQARALWAARNDPAYAQRALQAVQQGVWPQALGDWYRRLAGAGPGRGQAPMQAQQPAAAPDLMALLAGGGR